MFESHQGRSVVLLSKTLLHFLCLDNICPGRHTIYLSTIFRTVFRPSRHDCGLWHICVYIDTGFYNGLMQSRRQTVRRSCGHRAVSAAVHRNRTAPLWLLEAGRRSYGGCVTLVYFWKFLYQTCTTTHFLLEMALQMVKQNKA